MPLTSDSFRLRLVLLFGGLSIAFILGITLYINRVATAHIIEDGEERLRNLAFNVALVVENNLEERQREIHLLSHSLPKPGQRLENDNIRRTLALAKKAYRHYAWIGLTDADGVVRVAADGMLEGVDASRRDWFAQSRTGDFIGDVHEAVLLAKKLPAPAPGEPLRFVDFASPVHDEAGRFLGVVASHAHWRWVDEVIHQMLPADAEQNGIEVLIANPQGKILYPFTAVNEAHLPDPLREDPRLTRFHWPGHGDYMIGMQRIDSEPGWLIIVRQSADLALAPVTRLHYSLLIIGATVALLFMILAYRIAITLSRPLEHLAQVAQAIEHDDESGSFAVDCRLREIRTLADSLRDMFSHLRASKKALQEANASLEEKVDRRTRELREANLALEQLARHDTLTGLHNRLAANERLRSEFQRSRRSRQEEALLVIDVDHFKQVNDTWGHETGDQVLIHIADQLKASARQTDFVARLGGEEFLAILPDTSPAGAMIVAEKIRADIADSTAPTVGRVTVSIGVGIVEADDKDEDDALRRADQALYRAKGGGRNCVMR